MRKVRNLTNSLKQFWQRNTTNRIAIVLVIAFLIIFVGGYSKSWLFSWTGLGDYIKPSGVDERGKTLWNWLELLIIPAVLAGAALWFNKAERKSERGIADERLRESALQAYLDRMTDLLLQGNLRTSEIDGEVRVVARAWTLTALRQLDGARKGMLLKFLTEADLIDKDNTVIELYGANLDWVDFSETDIGQVSQVIENAADLSELRLSDLMSLTNLNQANLSTVSLIRARLRGAQLVEANLDGANLTEASLVGANLSGANLDGANLQGSDLRGADLKDSQLSGANLKRASLREADLRGADLSDSDLSETDLHGIEYDSDTIWPMGFRP